MCIWIQKFAWQKNPHMRYLVVWQLKLYNTSQYGRGGPINEKRPSLKHTKQKGLICMKCFIPKTMNFPKILNLLLLLTTTIYTLKDLQQTPKWDLIETNRLKDTKTERTLREMLNRTGCHINPLYLSSPLVMKPHLQQELHLNLSKIRTTTSVTLTCHMDIL